MCGLQAEADVAAVDLCSRCRHRVDLGKVADN